MDEPKAAISVRQVAEVLNLVRNSLGLLGIMHSGKAPSSAPRSSFAVLFERLRNLRHRIRSTDNNNWTAQGGHTLRSRTSRREGDNDQNAGEGRQGYDEGRDWVYWRPARSSALPGLTPKGLPCLDDIEARRGHVDFKYPCHAPHHLSPSDSGEVFGREAEEPCRIVDHQVHELVLPDTGCAETRR